MAGPEVKDREWQTGLPPDTGVWHDELPPDPQGIDLPAYKPKWKQGPLPDVNAFLQQRAMQDMPTENLREERDKSLHLFETFGIPWFKDANAERLKAAKSKQDRFYKNWNAMMGAAPYGRQKALESIHPAQMVKEIAKGFTRFVESGVFGSAATGVQWIGEFIELGGGAVDQFSKLFSKNPDQIYNPYAEAIITAGRGIAKYGRESRENFSIYAMTGWEKLDEKMRETDLASYWSGQISEGVASSALSVLAVYLSGGVGAAGLIDKGMKVNKGLALLSTMSAAGGYQHARTQDENFMWSTVHGLADGMIEYAAETTFLEGVGKSSKALTSGFKEGGEEFFTGMLQNTRAGILENEKKGMSAYEGAKAAIISALQQAPLEVVAGFIGGYGMQGGANLTELVQKSRAVKKVETQQGIIDRTNKDVMEIRKKYKKSPKFAEKMISARIQQGMKELDVLEQTEEEAFAKEAEEAITPEAKGEVVPEAVQPPSQPSEEQPWTVSKKEYVGEIPATEASQEDWAKYSERRRKWSNATMAAVSRGDITAEQAEALGLPYDVRQWTGLPETLYHVTTAKTAVSKEGLKSRFELGQERGMGLGGGESEAISFTTDRKTAEGIKRGLLEARKVARGEITVQQMLDEAESGEGAEKPWLEDLMQNWQPGWKIGDAVPRGVSDLLRGVEHTRNVLGKTKAEMEGWSPTAEKPDFGNEKYIEWERPVSTEKQQEEAFDFYKRWAAHREVAGGPLDPLFFLSDVPGIAALDPGEIEIIEFKPRQGAMGMKKAALGEYITFSGEAVELAPSVAEKQAAAEAFRPEQMGGTPEEIVTPNLYIGNVTPGMKQRIAEGLEIDPKEVHGFLQEGFPTKRTSIKMTRAEATNYLTFATNLMDQMVQQIEETGSVTMTMNQLANVQALQGDIKALQAAIGYEVQPAQVTVRQAEKRKYAVTGEPIISQERFNEINKKIAAGEELTEQDKADMFVALQEEAAAVKATTEIHTTKQLIEAALRPDKLETIELPTLELFNRVMKGKEDAAKYAYIAGARNTVKQHKNLAQLAKIKLKGLNITEGQRNQLLNAVARGRTESSQITAMAAVQAVAEKAYHKQAQIELRSAIKSIPKFGGKIALRQPAIDKIVSVLEGVDLSSLSDAKRSELEGYVKELNNIGVDVLGKVLSTPDIAVGGLAQEVTDEGEIVQSIYGAGLIKQLARLQKVSITDMEKMSADDLLGIADAIKFAIKQNEDQTSFYREGAKQEWARVLPVIDKEVIPTRKAVKETKSAGISEPAKERGVLGWLNQFATTDSKKRWALVETIVGNRNTETGHILDTDIHEGKKRKLDKEFEVYEAIQDKLDEIGWTTEDWKRIDEKHIVTIKGKQYRLTTGDIMSLAMNARDARNAKQLPNAEYLEIGDRRVETMSISNIIDMENEFLTEKERAFMDFVPVLNESILMPAGNEVSDQIVGFSLFTNPTYWGLRRIIERGVRGRTIEGAAIEDSGMFQEFKGSKLPLRIIPFWDQFLNQIQTTCSYYGMALPYKNARTLLNNRAWREKVKLSGREDELRSLTQLFRRAQGIGSDSTAVDVAAQTYLSKASKSVLGFRPSAIMSQPGSLPMAFSGGLIPTKYSVTLNGFTPQGGKAQSLRVNKYSSELRMRHIGGRTNLVTGDLAATHAVDHLLFYKYIPRRSRPDMVLDPMRHTDRWTILQIDKAVQRWVADTTNLKPKSEEFWKEVARRTEDVVRKSQPMWDMDERSVNSSSREAIKKGYLMFRSARESMWNQTMMGADRIAKSDRKGEALNEYANTLAAVTASHIYVKLMKNAIKGGLTLGVAMLLGINLEDDKEENRVLKTITEISGDIATDVPIVGDIASAAINTALHKGSEDIAPDNLIFSSIELVGRAIVDYKQAYSAWAKDQDDEKLKLNLVEGTLNLIDAISRLKGIPISGIRSWTADPLLRAKKKEKKSFLQKKLEELKKVPEIKQINMPEL